MIVAEDYYPHGIAFNDPWPFIVVDDFLSPGSYKYILGLRQNYEFAKLDGSDGKKTLTANHPDASKWKGTIKFQNKILNDELFETLCRHIGEQNIRPYVLISEVVNCDPGYMYSKHADHPLKLYSIVVYIEPEQGNGTIILDANNKEYEIMWRRNRALIFKNSPDAYHYYKNTFPEPRISLNVNIVAESAQFKVTESKQ